jgi:hypothetical protein
VASVGTLSGVAGTVLKPIVEGAQLWVQHTNQAGGLGGHPVRFLVFDDGGDPARHRGQVREAVERHHAIAFLANVETLTGHASVDYLSRARVPVIGTDTATAATNVFPSFRSDTPATAEYQRARRTFGRGATGGEGPPLGWAAGKLLERAAAALDDPPTTGALLRGLWSIRADTLGGLTAPLTFVEGSPPVIRPCWFNIRLNDGAWTSPDAFALHCDGRT